MSQTWIVMVPFILVILTTLFTRNVIASLGLGIVSSCIIASNWKILDALKLFWKRFIGELTDPDHLYIFIFLIALSILIELIAHSGALTTYAKKLQKKIRSARAAQTTTLTISILLFADDYLNILISGSLFRPLTDTWKIPRIKLAYLLNSVSGPLCVIFPLTSWVAMILAQMDAAGISTQTAQNPLVFADPFAVYLTTIPFLLYPILSIFSAWFVVLKDISFGKMKQCELHAEKTGCVAVKTQEAPTTNTTNKNGSLIDFIGPIALLIFSTITSLLYSGGYWLLGGSNTLFKAIMTGSPFWALFIGALSALCYALIRFIHKKTFSKKELYTIARKGTQAMLLPLAILFFAWIFSSILKNDLQTGAYLAHLVLQTISPWLLPCIVFLLAMLTTAATGSTWGTIAVLFPIVIPMTVAFYPSATPTTLAMIPLLLPILGATLSGTLAGSHVSPITDATVMAATGAGAHHLTHVKTQLVYSIPAIISSIVAYLIIGIYIQQAPWISLLLSYATALTITIILFLIFNKKSTHSPQQKMQ